jgi:transcriptional regulator with XRE-family HTH domain
MSSRLILAQIGPRFRAQRQRRSITQEQAAKSMNISRSQLANVESGDSAPGLDLLVRAADAFCVSVDYLLGRTKK